MSFYQIKKSAIRSEMEANSTNEKVIKNCERQLRDLSRSVFVSTGGNPSIQQFKGMMQQTADTNHHLCFDRDMAGRMFAVNFLLAKCDSDYKINLKEKDCPVVATPEATYYFPFNENFDLNEIAKSLSLETSMHSHPMPLVCKVQNLLIADFLNYLALRHNVYLSTMSELLKKKPSITPSATAES